MSDPYRERQIKEPSKPDTELTYATQEQVVAAREIIRSHSQGKIVEVISISELLDEMGIPLSPDMSWLLHLIWQLWSDPHIDQVPSAGVDFASSDVPSSARRAHPVDGRRLPLRPGVPMLRTDRYALCRCAVGRC